MRHPFGRLHRPSRVCGSCGQPAGLRGFVYGRHDITSLCSLLELLALTGKRCLIIVFCAAGVSYRCVLRGLRVVSHLVRPTHHPAACMALRPPLALVAPNSDLPPSLFGHSILSLQIKGVDGSLILRTFCHLHMSIIIIISIIVVFAPLHLSVTCILWSLLCFVLLCFLLRALLTCLAP
jgi:hypothetical protein